MHSYGEDPLSLAFLSRFTPAFLKDFSINPVPKDWGAITFSLVVVCIISQKEQFDNSFVHLFLSNTRSAWDSNSCDRTSVLLHYFMLNMWFTSLLPFLFHLQQLKIANLETSKCFLCRLVWIQLLKQKLPNYMFSDVLFLNMTFERQMYILELPLSLSVGNKFWCAQPIISTVILHIVIYCYFFFFQL